MGFEPIGTLASVTDRDDAVTCIKITDVAEKPRPRAIFAGGGGNGFETRGLAPLARVAG